MTPAQAFLLLTVAGGAALAVRKIRRAWELKPGNGEWGVGPGEGEEPMRFPIIPPAGLIPDASLDETPGYVLVGDRPASPWLMSLPRESVPRDDMIVERWRDLEYTFADVEVRSAEHVLVYGVFADGAKIDGVRVTVTARCEQMLADKIAGQMMTPKMEDDVYGASDFRLPMMFETSDSSMFSNEVMVSHSRKMDAVLATMGYSSTGGAAIVSGGAMKSWDLQNSLRYPKAMNYGFFGPRAPHLSVTGCCRVVQQPGTWHDLRHYDYSQTCRLAHRLCYLDGIQKDIQEIMRSAELGALLNVGGPLTVLRQPGVPETSA